MANDDLEGKKGTMFTGDICEVRVFPFALEEWERRMMTRAYMPVVQALNAGHPARVTLPLWFQGWLALRTARARLKQHGK